MPPFLSWVFCPLPICWGLDTGWNHTFGECWLKWQADVRHPLFGQRGRYSESFRRKNWDKHLSGRMPDGSKRNLTPPTHVPWTGGVIGRSVDYPRVTWTTDLPGADGAEMSSSAGERSFRTSDATVERFTSARHCSTHAFARSLAAAWPRGAVRVAARARSR